MEVQPLHHSSTNTSNSNPTFTSKAEDCTFNILQLNANGIRNKLNELGILLKRDKVKIAMIQESKLSSKSKIPYIQNYTTVRRDRSKGQGGGLLMFIRSSKPITR